MVLMHTIGNLSIPFRHASKFGTAAVAFNEKKVAGLQPVAFKLAVWHINLFYLGKIEITLADIGHAQIRMRTQPRSVRRAFLHAVADCGQLSKPRILEL